MVGLDI